MNSEGTNIAPGNLKVKSRDSNLDRDEKTIIDQHDIAIHLKEMEQVVIWLICHSMYVPRQNTTLYMSYTILLLNAAGRV